jgi:hypothetical protein
MPVTKKQKLNDNRVVLKKQRRQDPGLPIGRLTPGTWEIVYLEGFSLRDLAEVLEEEDVRARETARRVIPLLPSTTPSFTQYSSSSSSLQRGVKRKARPREDDVIMDSDSGSDSSFALISSSSSRGKRTSKKKKRSSGSSSTRRITSVSGTSFTAGGDRRHGVRPFTPEPGREYKFNCEFDLSECQYATDIKPNFDKHMDIHNDVRYGCDQCTKTFAQKGNVKTHIRFVHRGQKRPKQSKNIPCKRGCGKMFITNYMQTEHFYFHHDNNPWTCTNVNCNYESEQKSKCRRHIKNIHDGVGEPIKKKDRT